MTTRRPGVARWTWSITMIHNKPVFLTISLPSLWDGINGNIKWIKAAPMPKKTVTLTEKKNRLAFKALYICDRYPRASAKPNSHTSCLSGLLEKYCTPCTLYWPVNCRIKKKYNSCQAAANTRHCSLRDLLRKYKSLHLMAWLYKHSLNGVYFRIQDHKICQWPPCRNSLWGHFILRSNAFNFHSFHENKPSSL